MPYQVFLGNLSLSKGLLYLDTAYSLLFRLTFYFTTVRSVTVEYVENKVGNFKVPLINF